MEEGGAVAYLGEFACYAADVVEGVAGKDKGLDKHGYATENGGHGIDALAAVGV